MAGIAALSYPLINVLYGPRWLDAAPLLGWVALSQLCYISLPLNADLPLLLGRMKGLIHRNIAETVASVLLIAVAAPFGLAWVAISRLVHGLIWIVIYAPFMRDMLDFRWRDLGAVYARSLLATLAAVGPLLASYALWHGPVECGIGQAAAMVLAGVICWLTSLRLTRHPLFAEMTAMLDEVRASVPFRRATPAHR